MQFSNSEIIVEFRAKPTVHYFVKTNFPNLSICIMACIKTTLAIFPIQKCLDLGNQLANDSAPSVGKNPNTCIVRYCTLKKGMYLFS